MSTTPPIGSATRSWNAETAARVPQKTLGQQEFLELLTVQLRAQDPLNPMKDTDFIAQMAQFTSLEQARANQAFAQASTMLGRPVSLRLTRDSEPIKGQVTGVLVESGVPKIVVDGRAFPVSQLYSLHITEPQP
jgi:flagellar basal-body rod modification protein FlgD